jgi:CheY-like chemotaxis protein
MSSEGGEHERDRRVLVVDDDGPVRDALREILELEGYDVLTAENGLEALGRLRQGPRPAMILVDILMPVMDGWQFCAAQSEDPELRQIPVVVLSATREQQPPAQEHPADFLHKPPDIPRLLSTVARYCCSEGAAGTTK